MTKGVVIVNSWDSVREKEREREREREREVDTEKVMLSLQFVASLC
jgi:hypothetical protein